MNRVQQNTYRATVKIPGVGAVPMRKALPRTIAQRRKAVYEADVQSKLKGEIFKPERIQGAVWMDDFVAQRQTVRLCVDCDRRYSDWWKFYGFCPDRHPLAAHLSTCDGCTAHLQRLTPFHPEESYKDLQQRVDPATIVKGVS
jgi:hypothetical protein